MADEAGDQRLRLQDPDEAAEVNALLEIEKDPVLSAVLKNYMSRLEHINVQIERQWTRKAELNTDVFNIVGFFSVFQGVILAAVSQLKSDTFSTCGLISFPIILSGLAAVVGIAALWSKYTSIQQLKNYIRAVKGAQWEAERKVSLLKIRGSEYYNTRPREARIASYPNGRSLLLIKRIPVFLAMILFTAIFILSYFAILCDCLVIRKWNGGLSRTSAPSPSSR